MPRWSQSAFRAAVLAAGFACIGFAATRRTSELSLTVEHASEWFPQAAEVSGGEVTSAEGTVLGRLVQTAPASDAARGYAGPTNVLVALAPDERVLGFRILESADTSSHLAKIGDRYWEPWLGKPFGEAGETPLAVSGATLTSEAIAAGLRARATGIEVAPWFAPPEESAPHILWSTATPRQVRGFQGPSALRIELTPDRKTVVSVQIAASRDNDTYVGDVRDELKYTTPFAGKTVAEILAAPEASAFTVSGASVTAESVHAQIRATLAHLGAPAPRLIDWRMRDTILTLWLATALAIGLTHWRGNAKLRRGLQLACVVVGGIVLGTFVTLGLLIGWARNGLPWSTYPALVLLVFASLLVPLATGKNVYCHQVCPHGALQHAIFDLVPKKWAVPERFHRWLVRVPKLLLVVIFGLAALSWAGDFSVFEAFDTWSSGLLLTVPLFLWVVGIAAAAFVRAPYCKYACPTGALLSFAARPGKRDWLAAVAVVVAWGFVLV